MMSVKLVFQDDKGTTLHEKELPLEGTPLIPVQGDLVLIPGGEQITVVSRQFVYPDSEHGQIDVQVIFVSKREKKHTSGLKKLERC
jgi:hypothetical protein